MSHKKLYEQREELQKAMRQLLDAAHAEERDLTEEESAKFDELSEKADQITESIRKHERVAELEALQESRHLPREVRDTRDEGVELPGQIEKQETREQLEKRAEDAFGMFLRDGASALSKEQRDMLRMGSPETRAVTIGGGSGFGVVGVRPFFDQLVESMKSFVGVREAGAEILATANGNPLAIPTADDTGNVGQILSEGTEETNTDTGPTVGSIILDGYKYSSKFIRLSLELLQDAEFPVEQTIIRMASERIGRIYNTHSTTGNGTNKPRGFVTAAGTTVEAASNGSLDYDDLLDLLNGIDSAYWNRPSTAFQFSQSTLTQARKLTDTNGLPIWNPAFGDRGETIHGKRIVLNNDLAEFGGAQNDVVAAYGDFSTYKVRDVTTPTIIRLEEKFSEFGQVGFIVFSRHDGDLTDSKAVALLDLPA